MSTAYAVLHCPEGRTLAFPWGSILFDTPNQNPEQSARDRIDAMLAASGWVVQDKKAIDFNAGMGIAVREYQTDIGPADYVLFVEKVAVGVIEAKKENVAQNITTVEEQTAGYAKAKLKWVANCKPLPFLYESTGLVTRFTNLPDPKDLAEEIVENIEAGLNNFRTVLAALGK